MQRILVIGNSGSGKSTLARELGRRLSLPVIHLDTLFWQPGWTEHPDKPAFQAQIRRLALAEQWVIDGGYMNGSIEARLARADTVVFFDFPTWLCLWRVCRRGFTRLGKTRPDMAAGCVEKIPDLEFLTYVATYRSKRFAKREAELAQSFSGRIVRLRGPADVAAFLASV